MGVPGRDHREERGKAGRAAGEGLGARTPPTSPAKGGAPPPADNEINSSPWRKHSRAVPTSTRTPCPLQAGLSTDFPFLSQAEAHRAPVRREAAAWSRQQLEEAAAAAPLLRGGPSPPAHHPQIYSSAAPLAALEQLTGTKGILRCAQPQLTDNQGHKAGFCCVRAHVDVLKRTTACKCCRPSPLLPTSVETPVSSTQHALV